MRNFSALFLLTLASGWLLADSADAQTCGSSYIPPAQSWSVASRTCPSAGSYHNYVDAFIPGSGATALPRKYPVQSIVKVNSFHHLPVNHVSLPVYSSIPMGSHFPAISTSSYSPSSNIIPSTLVPTQFGSTAPSTCSNGTCRFN